ncbi:beclin-1-like [Antedon mediterranea]|uniref:beclin-1-like n=1 Tax=Antedon mediterranea TaxID=105859 RepID=UPI003AF85874
MAQIGDSQRSGVASTHVSFVCQRCCAPLKLDPSFNSLDSQTYSDLASPLIRSYFEKPAETTSSFDQFDSNKDDNVARKEIITQRMSSTDSSHEFTILGEAGNTQVETRSYACKIWGQLFDIMSGHSDVDHPLCEECTDSLLDGLDIQLKTTEDELKHYTESLAQLKESDGGDVKDSLSEELDKLCLEEKSLIEELESMEAEKEKIKAETEKQKEELQKYEDEEKRYWSEYSVYKRQLLEIEDEQRSVDNQLKYAQAQLDKLTRTNVFNATFHIWHSGHFGTINNFRLGRLPSVPVEWSEINAAWGQTVLLLYSLAKKMQYDFQRYRLVPYGNHSFLESLSDKNKELPLHGSGGFRFFWDTKFDQAMVAFLDCLQQFKEEVEKGDKGFCLPYPMVNGKIEDPSTKTSYSIKIQFNSEEHWTKALKFMLTNLKWALAWVSSQFKK